MRRCRRFNMEMFFKVERRRDGTCPTSCVGMDHTESRIPCYALREAKLTLQDI